MVKNGCPGWDRTGANDLASIGKIFLSTGYERQELGKNLKYDVPSSELFTSYAPEGWV